MKKLLVLMLMLGLATSANAIVLQISVGGDPAPVDSQIWLEQSQELVLDIHAAGHSGTSADDVYWAIVVDSADAHITGGMVIKPPAPSMSSVLGGTARANYFPGLLGNEDGPWGSIASAPGETAPAGIYYNDLIFHCDKAEGDAVIRLLTTQYFDQATIQDTLIIHQVPEPMTVALLGMGGLFLLRRRR